MARKGGNLRHIRRRRLLGTLGALALGSCGGSGDVGPCTLSSAGGLGTLSCTVTPSATDGPYFVDAGLNHPDPTTASVASGRTLYLHFRVRAGIFEFTLTRDAASGGYVRVFTIGLQL